MLVTAAVRDVTERRAEQERRLAAEERYRTLVEQLPRSAVALVGPDLRLRWLGGRAVRDVGLDAESMVGQRIGDGIGGGDYGARLEGLYARALAGESVATELHSERSGRDFSIEIAPLRAADGSVTGALGVAQDITERKQTEQALTEEHRQLAEAQSLAQLGSWHYELAAGTAVCRWSAEMWRIAGREPQAVAPLPAECLAWVHPDDRARLTAAVLHAIAEGQAVREEFRIVRPDDSVTHVELRVDVCSDMAAGKLVRGTVQDVSRQRAVLEQLRAATERAEQIARELEDEVRTAAAVQQGLLPTTPPRVDGVSLGGLCVPAAEVGGDYYDFMVSPSGAISMVIADVAGHSISSALLMAMARAVLREHVGQGDAPHEVLEATNATMYADLVNADLFITLFCASYEPTTGTLVFANGGHNRPLLRRADGSIEELDADGAPAGVLAYVGYEAGSTQLAPGDLLVLFTDGVVESGIEDGDPSGDERLARLVAGSGDVSPEDLGMLIHAAVVEHAGVTAARRDDITVAALLVDGGQGPQVGRTTSAQWLAPSTRA
jgi:sigma-B regulation protein RsbU (phosphoserine phosphatase)